MGAGRMCGRVRQEWGGEEAAARVGGRWAGGESAAAPGGAGPAGRRPNAGPGSRLAVCVRAGGGLAVEAMRGGLLTPAEARGAEPADPFRRFNARGETAREQPSFARLLRAGSRCVLPVQGFYEWHVEGPKSAPIRQPYYLFMADCGDGEGSEDALLMAGLYDRYGGTEEGTFTVLTTEARERVAWLHGRMPVILPNAAAARRWLRSDTPLEEFVDNPYCGPRLRWRPVSPKINSGKYQGPDCARLTQPEARRGASDLRAFLQQAGGAGLGLLKREPAPKEEPGLEPGSGEGSERGVLPGLESGPRVRLSATEEARTATVKRKAPKQQRLSFAPPPQRPRLRPEEQEAADLAEALERSQQDF